MDGQRGKGTPENMKDGILELLTRLQGGVSGKDRLQLVVCWHLYKRHSRETSRQLQGSIPRGHACLFGE